MIATFLISARWVSKDFGKHHLDFNESVQWLGRPDANGFDRNYFTAVAYTHPVSAKFQVTVEIAGYSRANATTVRDIICDVKPRRLSR